jgi:phosphatidate phosphatase APP1
MLVATFVLVTSGAPALPAADKPGRPGLILMHAAYGTPTTCVITGRVVEDKGIRAADPGRGRLANTLDTVKALESDEIAGAVVEIQIEGFPGSVLGTTDVEGNFVVAVDTRSSRLQEGWLETRARLKLDLGHPAPEAKGRLLVVADAPGVAVISDFDDTVVESRVTDKAALVYRTLTRNAAQLEPVPGVAAAYQAADRAGVKAFFYVSGSPENLHERIAEFLGLQRLPLGPILLKNFSTEALGQQQEYKRRRIEAIMAAFPKLQFLLVGDSGEKDPEIYLRAQDDHPERIVGIVIRKVVGADNDDTRLKRVVAVDDYSKKIDVIAELAAHVTGVGGQHVAPKP